jgi:hypothetical protein
MREISFYADELQLLNYSEKWSHLLREVAEWTNVWRVNFEMVYINLLNIHNKQKCSQLPVRREQQQQQQRHYRTDSRDLQSSNMDSSHVFAVYNWNISVNIIVQICTDSYLKQPSKAKNGLYIFIQLSYPKFKFLNITKKSCDFSRSASCFLCLDMAVQILTGQLQKTRVLVPARKIGSEAHDLSSFGSKLPVDIGHILRCMWYELRFCNWQYPIYN